MRRSILALITIVSSPSFAATLEVRLDPAYSVLEPGKASDAEVHIQALDAQGQPVRASDIVLHTTAGTISRPREIEPGRLSATLSRPSTSFPQLAVITAANLAANGRDEPPLLTQAVIAYAARITLRGQTETQSDVSLIVGDKRYEGTVAPDGTFATSVVVPPGVQFATGIARDTLGNTSRWPIDLFLPDVQRVYGFIYPERVEANGRAHLFVTALSSKGGPDAQAAIRVSARDGELDAGFEVAPGLVRFAYRAPLRLARASDLLKLSGGTGKAEFDFLIDLGPAPPASIAATPALVPLGSSATVKLVVRDAFGNPIKAPHVWVDADGRRIRHQAPIVLQNPSNDENTKKIKIVSAPEATPCRAPLIGIEDGRLRVVDAIGIPCGGAYRVIDKNGEDIRHGELTEGFVSGGLSANQQIIIEHGQPSVPTPTDVLPRYRAPQTTVNVTWHRPLPLMLSLRWLEPGRRLVVSSSEAGALTRLELRTTGMRVVGSQRRDHGLEVEVADVVAGARLVARDPRSGVSAWIGVR